MRVKTIELLGFKSFAQRTRLDFGDGIAAIVGPNGSGKSNLVDAVRWVLGEQSYGQLRGRRTEDVVWGGGAKRAAAGMAEVTITLDNTDRSLPSPYAEVAITRRAYRSGENEYLINRSRVRLRDVVELTSALGQNHTVVGQGAVESLLALTPQGRRGVFEDAADIATHYARRDETLQRLARVQSDATRARDVEAEIEPRLRSLARQARQARDRKEIEQELAVLTIAYHSREVSQARVAVQTTAAALGDAEVLDRRLTHESSSATEREAGARSAEGAARTNLRELEARRTVLADEYAHASRAAASSQAWLAEVERQAATTAKHHAAAELACQAAECKLADADEALRLGRLALDEAQQTFAEQKRRLSTEAERAEASREALRELRRKVHTADEEAARARSRAAALDSALASGRRDVVDRRKEQATIEASRCAAKDAERRAHTVFERCETAVRAADCELEAEAQARGDLDRELAEASNLCGGLRSQAAGLQSKLALLRDPSGSPGAYSRPVHWLQQASANGELEGVLGALGGLLRVPAEYETAVEAALGGQLYHVVVRRWADAEAAVALLCRNNIGRITFLPLDTLRPGGRPNVSELSQVIGIASDLVEYSPDVEPAVRHALGRVLLVENLSVARKLVGRTSGVGAIATLAGEIVRASGTVTGGGPARESGLLTREREARETQHCIERLATRLADAEDAERTLAAKHAALAETERQAALHLAAARTELRSARAAHQAVVDRVAHIERQLQWGSAALDHALALEADKEAAYTAAAAQQRESEEHAAGAEKVLEAMLESSTSAESAGRDAADRLTAQRTSIAVLAERLTALEAKADTCREASARAVADVSRYTQEARATAERASEARRKATVAEETELTVHSGLTSLDERAAVARRRLEERTAETETARRQASNLAAQLGAVERDKLQRDMSARAACSRLASALELARYETGRAEFDDDRPTPYDLEARIGRCRERITRIGPVNPLAAAELDELRARSVWLRSQLDDLDKAERDLHQVIGSLEAQMQQRFEATFSEVSSRFCSNFERLFKGGSARLALVAKDDYVGVDIQARPPGKREGALASLSGGERALTACALLFALVGASGAPFCILDEVDAALDESNVGRFCDLLQELSRSTQCIVVTHNRGTIERADRLFGVSMDAQGVSQMLSLRLDDVRRSAS